LEPESVNLRHQQITIDCYVIVKELLDPISRIGWEPESLHTEDLAGHTEFFFCEVTCLSHGRSVKNVRGRQYQYTYICPPVELFSFHVFRAALLILPAFLHFSCAFRSVS
jgi:hypothetical protein